MCPVLSGLSSGGVPTKYNDEVQRQEVCAPKETPKEKETSKDEEERPRKRPRKRPP